jgi:voltage-gated potassium channel
MNRRNILRRILDVALFVITLGAVAASLIEGMPEWLITIVLLSYVTFFFSRWWIDTDRMAWMKSNWFDLVLVVLLTSPLLRILMAFKIAGLVPALRIGAFVRANKDRLLRLLLLSGDSLPAALALMFGVVFIFGTGAFILEHGTNPQFRELQDGLWWALVTLTTVGYGDIAPITAAGRAVAVMTMIFGMIAYSLVIANLTVFIEDYRVRQVAENHSVKTKQQPEE